MRFFDFLSLLKKVLLFSETFKLQNQEEEGGTRKVKVKWNRVCQRLSRKFGRKRCDGGWVVRKPEREKLGRMGALYWNCLECSTDISKK